MTVMLLASIAAVAKIDVTENPLTAAMPISGSTSIHWVVSATASSAHETFSCCNRTGIK
jgi:hypothetical protein